MNTTVRWEYCSVPECNASGPAGELMSVLKWKKQLPPSTLFQLTNNFLQVALSKVNEAIRFSPNEISEAARPTRYKREL